MNSNGLLTVIWMAAFSAMASDHWAYQLPGRASVPASRAQTEIDAFILAKLDDKKIHPVPGADKAVLARRVYFDLIGLPPTPEQIDEFVSQPFEHSVDR